ncbi:unnamed protein product [Caretta caretta]
MHILENEGVGFGEKKGKDKMCQACGIRNPKRNRGGIFQKSKEEANEEKHEKVNLKTMKQVLAGVANNSCINMQIPFALFALLWILW